MRTLKTALLAAAALALVASNIAALTTNPILGLAVLPVTGWLGYELGECLGLIWTPKVSA